jgi:hypothetical protein
MKRLRSQLALVCGLVFLFGVANVALGVIPTNNNCNNAKAVGNVTNLAFDTTNATHDGPGYYINSPNLWYCYTATCNGCATVSLAGSSFDTKLAVYEGCDCYPSEDDLIKTNDDFDGQQSQITFAVKAGSQYLIEVGGFNVAAKGQGVINISCDNQASQPANDDCSEAQQVGNVTELPFDTTCATFDGPGHFFTSPNLWYRYTASSTGDVTVSLLLSEFDTALVVYDTGNCYPKLDDIIESNDDFGGFLQSQITFHATAGRSYLFEVLGYNSDEVGEGVLTISSESSPPPSGSNDSSAHPKPVGDVTDLPFDTTGATLDGPHFCMYSPNIWFCYTASCTGDVTVSLAGSSYDTMLAIWKRCVPDLYYEDMIECNDDFENNRYSKIVFEAVAGNQYMIEVGGYGNETGQGLLSISCEGVTPPPSSKDDCQNAKAIGDIENLPFDTTDATFDGPGLCMTSPNIWYCYTATCTGDVTVSLAGSSFDTMLAVYDGCECYPTSNDLIECNDDAGGGYHSAVTFASIEGKQYLIEVGGYGSETGEGLLTINCEGVTPPSSKDDCQNAKAIGDIDNLPFDTTDATFDGLGLCMTSPNIWYCYTATCTGDVTVSLAGSSFDTMLAVYDGCECYPTSNDLIECNDDAGSGYHSEITFAATEGKQYLIEVGGYGSETGEGLLTISCLGVVPSGKTDLGDAPDKTNNFNHNMTAYMWPASVYANFPTVFNDGSGTGPIGPIHVNDKIVAYLGKRITRETEADTGADEDPVNNLVPPNNQSDKDFGDDGIVVPLNLPNCRWVTFDYTITVVDPNVDLWVNVWFDWNRDGDWDDVLDCLKGPVPEWAVQNQFLFNLPIGVNQITTPAILSKHLDDRPEEIWMRITLSEQPWKTGSNPGEVGNAGSGPQEKYQYGETEDYYFKPDVSYTICEDYNGDGVINMDDLVFYTAEWLENCP